MRPNRSKQCAVFAVMLLSKARLVVFTYVIYDFLPLFGRKAQGTVYKVRVISIMPSNRSVTFTATSRQMIEGSNLRSCVVVISEMGLCDDVFSLTDSSQ